VIEVEGLGVRLGGRDILAEVSLRVGKGESFGLVGESGGGKTTLLRVLAGALIPSAGVARIAGRAITRDRAFFRSTQMVFQDPFGSLHPRQTIDRILAEPLIIHGLDDGEGRIRRALDEVALPTSVRFRFPHQLSGGQRQRIAIARALIAGPSVLLLDEPTSALDVSVQAEILNLLVDLRRERGLTYLLVSHNLPVVAHLCDRLATMAAGRIVETLDVAALRAGRAVHSETRKLVELARALEPA